MYQNGKIVLALNNTGGVMSVYFGHELFHDLKQTAPKQANELQKYVLDRLKSNADYDYDFRYAQLEDKYSDNLKGKTAAQKKSVIDEEIAANACFTVLSNENNFTALVKRNRSLAEKVRDFFADFIEKIKNALINLTKINPEYKVLQNEDKVQKKILEMFNKALESSNENLNKSTGIKFSKKIDEYPYEEKKVIDGYLDAVDEDMVHFIVDFNNNNKFARHKISLVERKQANDIFSLLKIDTTGYSNNINTNAIKHIENRHGENGSADNSMKDLNDLARIDFILKNYDSVDILKDSKGNAMYSIEFKTKLNEPAPMLLYKKKINGTYYLVEAVVENKYKKLWVVSAYINKKGTVTQVSDGVSTPELYAQNALASSAPTNSISNTDENVKFSLKDPVEETKDLIAVHNISESNLLKSLDLGGFPMPSIAVMRALQADANADYGNISVVFNRDTIDPEVNSQNKVYGNDAWTPRFPTIEYEIDYDQASNIYSKAHELSKTKAAFTKAVSLHPNNIEDSVNRLGIERYIENLKNDYTLKQLYLLEHGGQPVEMQQREERTEVSEADAALYDYLLDAIPDYHYVSPFQWNKTYGAAFDQAYTDYYRNNFGFTEEQAENVLKNMNTAQKKSMMRAAQNYKENGRVTVTVSNDTDATKMFIDSKIDQFDFENWVDDTFAGITKRRGIRNNVEPYTSSGNSRSFAELHYEITLENLVRQMKTQGNGEGTFFSGLGIWGVAAKNYGTIDEIKSDSFRLQNLSNEEYSEIKQGFGERLTEISNSLDSRNKSDNPFIEEDNKMTNIIDALRSSKTKSGVLHYLNEYFTNASESTVDDLLDLVADIGNMPTQYFEAKPQRAVRFNEVAYVVIPDNASQELKSKLNENGIRYEEYAAGNEQSRVDTLNSLDDVKFSMKEEDNTSIFEDNEELAESAENVQNMLRFVATENNELRKVFDVRTVRQAEDSSVAKVAAYLRKQYDSTYKKSDLVSNLAGLYNYITNAGENIDNEYVWRTAKSIAANVLANTQYKDTTLYEDYKQLRERIRTQIIRVPENVRNDMTDYNDFRKRNFGKMRLSNDSGIALDKFYSELSSEEPAFFPPDAILSEQLENIENFFVTTSPVYYNGAEMMAESEGLSLDEYTNIVASDIFNQYFDVPEVKSYVSKSHEREMQELKSDYETQIKDMRTLYQQRYEDQLVELRKENEQRLADMKDKNSAALKKLKDKNLETIAKQKAHFKNVSKRATQRRNGSLSV